MTTSTNSASSILSNLNTAAVASLEAHFKAQFLSTLTSTLSVSTPDQPAVVEQPASNDVVVEEQPAAVEDKPAETPAPAPAKKRPGRKPGSGTKKPAAPVDPAAKKRGPGRPKMTDEQRAIKDAEKAAKKGKKETAKASGVTASDVIRTAYAKNPAQPVSEVIELVEKKTGNTCSAPLVYAVRAREDKRIAEEVKAAKKAEKKAAK